MAELKRILMKIAYDGTEYSGFQLQPTRPTIEGEINQALSELLGEDIRIEGASRTDAGVHALGNAAVFDTSSSIPPEKFPFALLKYLPDDIRVTASREVPLKFYLRKMISSKTYVYTYSCGPIEDPLSRRYASFSKVIPDVEAMKKGAEYLLGQHDFTSFANPSSEVFESGGSAVRNIFSIDVHKEAGGAGSLVKLRIEGDGFLYNMIRIISGTLMNVGRGRWEPHRIGEILLKKDRTAAGPTAEARGLKLIEIRFKECDDLST